MRLLYEDKLAPMTSELGFLECDFETVVREYKEWGIEIKKPRRIVREVFGNLGDVLQSLLPLTCGEERRILFIPTQSNWVAYFDNGHQGSEISARIGYLYKRLQCRGIRACCIPHTLHGKGREAKGRYGGTIFTVFSPHAEHQLGYERVLHVMNDGGPWDFENFGKPYDFEDVERYKARRIRDRFTPEMLRDYLLHFGIDAFNEDFYKTTPEHPAVLFEKLTPQYPQVKEYTLEEARADY